MRSYLSMKVFSFGDFVRKKIFYSNLYLILIVFLSLGYFTKLYSKDLTVGIILNNDKLNFKIAHTLNKLIPFMFKFLSAELKEEFPKTRIKYKYFFIQKESITAKKAIEKAIADKMVDLVFGPFSSQLLSVGKSEIESGSLAFVSYANLSSLRTLKNYYSFFEWSDVYVRTVLDYAKKSLQKNKLYYAGVFLWNRDFSRNFYEGQRNI